MKAQPLAGLLGAALLLCWATAGAQSADEMNAANNPLQPTLGFNLHDYYTSDYFGLDDADSNAFLLRGVLPHKQFGKPQILRATLAIVTSPDLPPSGDHTDVGDFNLFDVFMFKAGTIQIGVGPQLTAPTAGRDETGTGKWQAGLATLIVAPQKWGLVGGLVTWQHSFAGDSDRRTQDNLQVQPLVLYNLPGGWYLRSTALWTWDLEANSYYVPVGLGLGKIWKAGTTTYNLFAEPQWTVSHNEDGLPRFQLFIGLNLQFPLGPK